MLLPARPCFVLDPFRLEQWELKKTGCDLVLYWQIGAFDPTKKKKKKKVRMQEDEEPEAVKEVRESVESLAGECG